MNGKGRIGGMRIITEVGQGYDRYGVLTLRFSDILTPEERLLVLEEVALQALTHIEDEPNGVTPDEDERHIE